MENDPTMDPLDKPDAPPDSPEADRFGRTNWLLLAGGLALLVIGFFVLSLVDERAANLAGRLSPFLILGGYGLIFVSLILRSSR